MIDVDNVDVSVATNSLFGITTALIQFAENRNEWFDQNLQRMVFFIDLFFSLCVCVFFLQNFFLLIFFFANEFCIVTQKCFFMFFLYVCFG